MELQQIVVIVVCCILPFLLSFLINKLFKKIQKRKNDIALIFAKNIIEVLIFLGCIVTIIDMFDTEKVISQRILMSSSVLAIVLGIVFQTGLTNLVHGVMLVIYKPFNVGDRVQIDTGTGGISGYVKQITLRHVVISNIIDNADLIIPNSLVETSVIRNLNTGVTSINKYPLIVSMTYEQAQDKEILEKAKHIISQCILNNLRTVDECPEGMNDLFVKVDYSASSVDLTCFVSTLTAENNFFACSEIKEEILSEFGKNGIDFAYNHLTISGKIEN